MEFWIAGKKPMLNASAVLATVLECRKRPAGVIMNTMFQAMLKMCHHPHAAASGGAVGVWSALLGLGLLLAGCGKSGELRGPADDGLPPEAVAVRQAFADAHVSIRHPVEEMLRLVRAGEDNPGIYAEVVPQLQRLAANPTISAEQKQALEALIQSIRARGSAGS